jgi:hypothetical protein
MANPSYLFFVIMMKGVGKIKRKIREDESNVKVQSPKSKSMSNPKSKKIMCQLNIDI